LPLNEWITNVARSTFAVDAGCTFTFGRLDGRSDGKLDGTVFAIAVDKNAPSSRTYLANTARDAVVGQAKNRSPVRDGFEKFPQMFRRAKTGVLGQICLKIPVNNSVFLVSSLAKSSIGGSFHGKMAGNSRQIMSLVFNRGA
jgi:hypothetical protein